MILTITNQLKKQVLGACAFLLILMLAHPAASFAKTITVASLPELQKAIDNAVAGDVILLKNGVYTTTDNIVVKSKGTAAKPITIAAETIGGAEINGTGGLSIQSPATYVIIRGFKFANASNKNEIAAGSSFCQWTRNIFEGFGEGNYLSIIGNDHQVDYNTFQNKNALGKFIGVRGVGKQIAERLWIHHNYFHNFAQQSGNGAESVQFGLSGFSLSSSNSIFEYNLFENCEGENELLSVKSSAVTIRYNTVRDCKAQMTLRHGNFNKVYGNYFTKTPGLRIFGDDHIIYSNYFENCDVAINIGNGGAEVADGAPLTSHDRPDRVLIAFNTLVNNKKNITLNPRTPIGLGATDITIINNLIQGGEEAAVINGPFVNPKWEGNIIYKVKGPGSIPEGAYKILDPKLVRDANGTFHLQEADPALNVAGTYPLITVDMDGQARKQPLQVGADQISSAPVVARILTPELVGYKAK
ncbi:MAG: polysaccharide lyase 6 family protein [Candidatus Pedobacter colombiensis]|uniref:Polysaccharide lyase 6 family protein n=1 Tax=Candidatus Pedobacter colombiensis TaxID=3121371 RepID=A0AAJ6B5P2_9SPHI|nr:polysaccharide lyase 6 family protein [Pedobacter sp.]WEK18345.1 MAG: polysaccharide lyase 6 family protein [Pedobacter sp.]